MADGDKGGKVTTREFLAERDLRMFKMRQAGVPIQEIGKRFGVSQSVVGKAISRQLEKLNREALLAYPEVLRMELERLDALQAAIWPMTQHRKVTLDDGTDVTMEPDMKAIQQVLSIMDRRSKLLGMDQNNVSVQMDVTSTSNENIRIMMSGEQNALPADTFDPKKEAEQLMALMVKAGVLSGDDVEQLVGRPELPPVIDVEVIEDENE